RVRRAPSPPAGSPWAGWARAPPTRAAITVGSSAYSSQALVPVVTVRSSRAPAWVRTIFRSGTTAPGEDEAGTRRWYRESPQSFAGITATSGLTVFTRGVQLRSSPAESASEPVARDAPTRAP